MMKEFELSLVEFTYEDGKILYKACLTHNKEKHCAWGKDSTESKKYWVVADGENIEDILRCEFVSSEKKAKFFISKYFAEQFLLALFHREFKPPILSDKKPPMLLSRVEISI